MHNYSINIAWSDEDEGFIATVPEFPNLSAFGKTYEEALKEAQIVLSAYLETLIEDGEPLPQPSKISEFSGQLRLRLPKDLHQRLALTAQREGTSLNTYMIYLLSMNYSLLYKMNVEGMYKNILITGVFHSNSGTENVGSRWLLSNSPLINNVFARLPDGAKSISFRGE